MTRYSEFKELSVLYVEDDTYLREVTEENLEMIVGTVYAVATGTEALEVYENQRVNVLILDIYLGDTNGLELAKEIRKTNEKIPIIIISGSIDTEDLLAACQLNLIEYIKKPIEFNALIKVLTRAVERLNRNGLLFTKLDEHLYYDYFKKSFRHKDESLTLLTKKESKIMELLISYRGQTASYDKMFGEFEEQMSIGALKNLILRLRRKMGGSQDILCNISKVGYSLL